MKKIEVTEAELFKALAESKESNDTGYSLEEIMETIGTRTPQIARRYVRQLLDQKKLRVGTKVLERIDGVRASVRTYVPVLSSTKGERLASQRTRRKRR